VISRIHCDANEIYILLGFYAM